MALVRLASSPLVVKPISSSSSSSSLNQNHRNRGKGGGRSGGDDVPARDRVVNFGKYNGRMLGTLPSNYLTWLSKNVKVWDSRAKEVLNDPVYQDRLEWDVLERFRSGDYLDDGSSRWRRRRTREVDDPIATMLEISNRFGWDNADKDAWENINFDLLGTSFGGRIPRKKDGNHMIIHMDNQQQQPHRKKPSDARKSPAAAVAGGGGGGGGGGWSGSDGYDYDLDDDEDEEKMPRKDESRALRTQQQVVRLRRKLVGGGTHDGTSVVVGGGGVKKNPSSSDAGDGGTDRTSSSGVSPFPGRGALLDRVMKRSG